MSELLCTTPQFAHKSVQRSSDIDSSLGLATNVLTTRLDGFVEAGLMERRTYSSHEDHYEYFLTAKGADLTPVVIALTAWGDRWAAPDGPPIIYRHEACDGRVNNLLVCSECGEYVGTEEVAAQPGPGSRSRPRISRHKQG